MSAVWKGDVDVFGGQKLWDPLGLRLQTVVGCSVVAGV